VLGQYTLYSGRWLSALRRNSVPPSEG